MKITSPAFENQGQIPVKFSCDGSGVNPQLMFSEVPPGIKSLALIVDDPDAPSGDFVHWLVWGIAPSTSTITEGRVPEGAVQGVNSSGSNRYIAPCPPSGVHHYFFKLYALDTEINLPETAGKQELLAAMAGHIIEQVELVGLYSRS